MDQRAFARNQRKQPTSAEDLLWQNLRGRKLDGLKFRRQFPHLGYVLDFCCWERKLVVELDGAGHASQWAYDQARTQEIEASGLFVIRFSNAAVLGDLEGVLIAIRKASNLAKD